MKEGIKVDWQVWFVGILFVVVYGIIVSEKIHRTIIALFGATLLLVLGILAQTEAISYINFLIPSEWPGRR
jgi:Na+/H+ antiporter NhaD/arsenite permease-like protein